MSYGCMFILRRIKDLHALHSELISTVTTRECGLCFEPMNNLLLEHSIDLGAHDVVFEVCDSFSSNDASLLLSHEGYSVNGVQAKLPLLQRLKILQDVALTCAPHAESIDIYLGEDTPCLSDYSDYRIVCADIAYVLYKAYQKDSCGAFIPCVHLIVE